MLYYIKSEIKRALFSKSAIIAFIIMLIALLLEFINELFINYNLDIESYREYYDSADAFLSYVGYKGSVNLLAFIIPLLAALVFSNSYLQDKESNFLKLIYVRMDKKRYIVSRIIVNAFSSGIIIVVALVVFLSIITLTLGFKTNADNRLGMIRAFSFLYNENKWLYVIYFIINAFIFNFIFSTLSLGLSPFINNKYLSFLSVFVIYMLSMTVTPYIGLRSYNMGFLFITRSVRSESFIMIYQSFLLILGITLFYLGVSYRNEKDL